MGIYICTLAFADQSHNLETWARKSFFTVKWKETRYSNRKYSVILDQWPSENAVWLAVERMKHFVNITQHCEIDI